eukprot:scaffold4852_cov28-Prasinocladus_malaysianus.AAC.2
MCFLPLSGQAMCLSADGQEVTLSSTCSQPTQFHFSSSGALVHNATNGCLGVAAGSTFGTSDSNPLQLGGTDYCDLWVFSFWTDWSRPPGYEDGWRIGGSASSNTASPPRWAFSVASPCEQYRMEMTDSGGSRAYGLRAVRGSDGAAFPSLVTHNPCWLSSLVKQNQ